MLIRFFSILPVLTTPATMWGQTIDFPNPPLGQVLDAGDWLGEDRRVRLEKELRHYRKRYEVDVMVILWDRGLPPETSLDELALRVGQTWERESFWVVVLHIPDSLLRPAVVYGGRATKRYLEEIPGLALHSASTRGMKERTTRAQVEALGLELGEEFVFLRHRAEFERKEQLASQKEKLENSEERHQTMIFRAVIATLLALVAVGVVALIYMTKRKPTDLSFPETRWRRRLGGSWSGGGQIVVSLPPRIS